MIPDAAPKHIRDLVDRLARDGRYHFTTAEAVSILGVAPVAARAALRRLASRGVIAQPVRGFWVIVPPEYRRIGCLPADQFVPQYLTMRGLPFYFGLLSAAQYFGAAHHRPQEAQVMLPRHHDLLLCGSVRIRFVTRHRVERVPTTTFNTPRGYVTVSTPEATALDLVGYPKHVGGLDGAVTVLLDLGESIRPTELARAAESAPLPWAQRLGYLMEQLGLEQLVTPLAQYVHERATEYVPLVPSTDTSGSTRSPRWNVVINSDIEPDR